jgi:membrane-bound lytic murein transglycosylase F
VSTWTAQYDGEFQRCTQKRLPAGWDWLRQKSQGCAESELNPNAVSPRGALGIMQWMPSDWPEWRDKCGYGADVTPLMAAPAIDCACAYMAFLYRQWSAPRPEFDRWRLALASYNAGLGNLIDAQDKASGVNDFMSIISYLPVVTGAANAAQTFNYVDRIGRIHASLRRPEAA